jgi:hypothetical protein
LLTRAIALLKQPQELYRQCAKAERRLLTLTIFDKLFVNTYEITGHELKEPFDALVSVQGRYQAAQKQPERPVPTVKAYRRTVGYSASWVDLDTIRDYQTDSRGTVLTDDAPVWDELSTTDLLALSLQVGGSFSGAMVELVQRYSKLTSVARFPSLTSMPGVPIERTGRSRVHDVRERLGPEAIAQLVADYQAGASTLALMKQYGIGKGTVLRILDDHGVARRHQPLTEGQVQQAIELYRQGWPLAKVGERLARDATVIHLALKRVGVQLRDCHGHERQHD